MLIVRGVFAALLTLACAGAQAQPSPFDGTWNVTMTCPPHDDDGHHGRGPSGHVGGEDVGERAGLDERLLDVGAVWAGHRADVERVRSDLAPGAEHDDWPMKSK